MKIFEQKNDEKMHFNSIDNYLLYLPENSNLHVWVNQQKIVEKD